MSFKMTRWRGIPVARLDRADRRAHRRRRSGRGLSLRAAWAQVEVFVTNYLGDSVTTYSRTVRGFRVPLRIIGGRRRGC